MTTSSGAEQDRTRAAMQTVSDALFLFGRERQRRYTAASGAIARHAA